MQSARCADGVRPSATRPEVSLTKRCGAWSTSALQPYVVQAATLL